MGILYTLFSIVAFVAFLGVVGIVLLAQTRTDKKKDDGAAPSKQESPAIPVSPAATEDSNRGTRRRPSHALGDKTEQSMVMGEQKLSFRMNATGLPPLEGRRSSLLGLIQSTSPSSGDIRKATFGGSSSPGRSASPSPSPGPGSAPSSPKPGHIRKQSSGKGVSFSHDQTSPSLSPGSMATTLGFPAIHHFEDIPSRVDAIETACFSEDGLLAVGGGPEDAEVRIFNKGTGTIGSLRHTINLKKDIGKHDSPSVLGFACDEGKKSTLLLVGTRVERFMLGYKISKSASTPPLLMFAFETKHGCPLAGVVGFIPVAALSYFDPGVFFGTCARGTREVKFWSAKGSPMATIDCDCWTSGLRLASNGAHVAILSSGAGPGSILEIKQDKHHHLKFLKTRLTLPIDALGAAASPQVSSRRSVLGDLAFQAGQDFVFQQDGSGASLLCCRNDLSVSIAHASSVDLATSWELETLLKPESLLIGSPTHCTVLVPKGEGRMTRVIISRGKHVFFFDASLALLGVLEGRREDGDVLGVALGPKSDFAIIVAFGGSIARLVTIP